MNKVAHTLVLGVFGFTCWFLWGILTLVSNTTIHSNGAKLPAFTQFLIQFRPILLLLPLLAAGYCLWILFRKTERNPSWMVFFATCMSITVLVMLPTLIAAYLPLLSTIHLQ